MFQTRRDFEKRQEEMWIRDRKRHSVNGVIISLFLLMSAIPGTATTWVNRPRIDGAYSILRRDTRLELSTSGALFPSQTGGPRISWTSSSMLFRAGALERDKRDSKLNVSALFGIQERLSLSIDARGWRREDTGTQSYDRSRGGGLEYDITGRVGTSLIWKHSAGAVIDRIATVGLGGEEHDNNGYSASASLEGMASPLSTSVTGTLQRRIENLDLNGLDQSDISMGIKRGGYDLRLNFFDHAKRYRTGSIEEMREEHGGRVGIRADFGAGAFPTVSLNFSGSRKEASYRENTNQDFMLRQEEAGASYRVPFLKDFFSFEISGRVSHTDHDESGRDIYDREEEKRSVEARFETGRADSLISLNVSHSLSLDQTIYVDPVNFSDHDIRDQKIVGSIAYRPGDMLLWMKGSRRANDLVYVDSERSANTSRTNEYTSSVGYSLDRSWWTWRQSFLISARYAHYRFNPDGDELSRRGRIESTFSGTKGSLTAEIRQKWLWDDNGPYVNDVFKRQELTEEVEAGIRLIAKSGSIHLVPGWRERWRLIYGPDGRNGGTVQPRVRESWLSLDVVTPITESGRFTMNSTLVLRHGGSRYWQARASLDQML